MHFHAEIFFPAGPKPSATDVQRVLEPHIERHDETTETMSGWWDWWQIGGRWKGAHVPAYDAGADPDHYEHCRWCNGTGTRLDMVVHNGCNGCEGTGRAQTWPTEWNPHPLDICRLAEALPDLTAHTVVIAATGEVVHSERFIKGGFEKTDFGKANLLEWLKQHGATADSWLVTVDYHS